MKNRFTIISLIITNLFIFILFSYAKEYKIAILKTKDVKAYNEPIYNFKTSLNEKLNCDFAEYNLNSDYNKSDAILKQLKENKTDLIFSLGDKASHAAIHKQNTIPVIFSMVLNWKKYDLKKSHSTGISLDISPDLLFTNIKLLLPKISRITYINLKSNNNSEKLNFIIEKAENYGIKFNLIKINDKKDVIDKLKKIHFTAGEEACWITPMALNIKNFNYAKDKCLDEKVPLIGFSEAYVRGGALLSISPNYYNIGSQAAIVAGDILSENEKIIKTKITPPIGTEFIINQSVAKNIGLDISVELYQFVDKIIDKD